MMVAKVVCAILIWNCLWLLLASSLTGAFESDINCLRALKSQLKDPKRSLSSWEFGNHTGNYVCHFPGVTCWNDRESRVLSIDLSSFDLEGEFPSGVKECSSLQSLNLRGNNLSSKLPPEVFSFLPYLITLDLSYNSFSGKIPATLSNLAFLNALFLGHNQFIGHIPPGLVSIPRLTEFSVAHNNLNGPIPEFTSRNIDLSSFEDNPYLCGFPLDPCQDSFFSMAIITAASAAAVCFPVGAAIGWFCIGVGVKQKQRPTRP